MGMEARLIRAAVLAAVLLVSMGARHQTPNFIVETPDGNLARQIGVASEKYRRELAVSWLGRAMPKWSQPCVMTVRVGPNLGAGGATTFMFSHGEVFGWRMTIQGSRERIFDSVLPHEITHMIFASHFRRPLPRWADEGGATSVEHVSERMKHRKMLDQFLRTGRGIAFSRMFAMREYPRDVMPLYAQGYSLAKFLIQRGGRRKYVDFLADGLESEQWSAALRRHYGIADLSTLQNTWLAWVQQGWPQPKSRQTHPAVAPEPQMLAAAGRRKRPEPNLIHHIRQKEHPSYAPGSVIPAGNRDTGRFSGIRIAAANPRPTLKQLPATGWRAMGREPARPPATAPPPPSTKPVRTQVAHPQPIERPRQIILEWSRE